MNYTPTKSTRPTFDLFPLSVATGQAFCNRSAEIELLKTYIERKRPVLISSPRRYGKTSLVLQTINQMQIPHIHIDLFSVVDEQDIERAILKGVGRLIQSLESIPNRALDLASSIFEGIHLRVVWGKLGIGIEVQQRSEKPAYHILEILERLERLAEKTQKPLILFIDEFQCISDATSDHAIESVLRQVTQLTKSISFIFSGSNRHLLSELFDDRKRPFYKLCERMTLGRIPVEAYTQHIQKAAQKQWQKELPQDALDSLFHYSELHPYYVNQLCSRLWTPQMPTAERVGEAWNQYVLEERSHVAAEIELLSRNQRKLLTVLSRSCGVSNPLGQKFIQQAGMPKTTIEQALTFLEMNDYVFKCSSGLIRVLDPLIKCVLSE